MSPPPSPFAVHRPRRAGPSRRQLVLATAALLAAAAPAAVRAAGPLSRARFRLARDFAVPADTFGLVPWTDTVFQEGDGVVLQPDGKVLVQKSGVYELVFSCDWDAKSERDIDLRKIGIRCQAAGQPDTPIDAHERLGFANLPGSDPPATARYQGTWAPPPLPPGAVVSTDVTVADLGGTVRPGDTATASHTGLSAAQMPDDALTRLIVQARVIADNRVRVSLFNPGGAGVIQVPTGTLRVVAMSSTRTRGSNGDAWMVLHTASTRLEAGDRVYGLVEHKVAGSLLQATKSSYLQIDRLG
ncbi:hypothetical protein [Ideonella sp.]|uniref:hypothetical protein n=1 Tax=Ideonella sp. TaxID=1929293 RepID=UPI0035B2B7C5